MAESIEYRPPTQSQKPNMFAGSIPNSDTRSALVETATKCLAIADLSPSWLRTQSRAEMALVSVSRVVKVFDDTINSVSSADRSLVASAKSVESTLETNRNVKLR